jgi:hypothetical protein
VIGCALEIAIRKDPQTRFQENFACQGTCTGGTPALLVMTGNYCYFWEANGWWITFTLQNTKEQRPVSALESFGRELLLWVSRERTVEKLLAFLFCFSELFQVQ